jgi:hypothetical protein
MPTARADLCTLCLPAVPQPWMMECRANDGRLVHGAGKDRSKAWWTVRPMF